MQKNLPWLILLLILLLACSKAGGWTTPLTKQTVTEPPAMQTVTAQPAKQTVAEPPTKQTVAEPPTKQAVAEPQAKETVTAPPGESLSVKSTRLTAGNISLAVRADPAIHIAQIQVDGAYRHFSQHPQGLGKVRIDIPYPWMSGETHHIAFLTGTGAIFEHKIDNAQETLGD